jgi:RNA polymerase sigma-70 factor (ECF subfamily)
MSPVNSKQRQFDALVRSLSGDLFRYAYWLCGDEALAHDLVQETFLRAWRALADLRETGAAKSWLITILRREHARLYERKTPQFADISEIEVADDRDTAQPEYIGEDAVIRAAIHRLDPKYREPLLMGARWVFLRRNRARTEYLERRGMTQLFRARQNSK